MQNIEEAHLCAVRDAREMVSRLLMTDQQIPWDNVIEVGTAEGTLFEVTFREAAGL